MTIHILQKFSQIHLFCSQHTLLRRRVWRKLNIVSCYCPHFQSHSHSRFLNTTHSKHSEVCEYQGEFIRTNIYVEYT